MKCKICSHPNKLQLEKQYIQGIAVAKIARENGLSENSTRNHMQNHISRQMMTSSKTQQVVASMELLTDIEELVNRTKTILAHAEDKKQYGLALGAIREVRGSYELLAKISWALHQARLSELEIERAKQREPDPEQAKVLNEMLDVLSPDEYDLYSQLNAKMLNKDPDIVIKINEKFEDIEDVQHTEESNDIIPTEEKKSFKRSKPPLKQEIKAEEEPDNTIPVPAAIEIPGGRGSRLSRHLIGRKVYEKQDEQRGIGGRQGGESLPYSNDPKPTEQGGTFERTYKDD